MEEAQQDRAAARPGPPPWQASYPPGCRWDTPLRPGTIPELLHQAVARWGSRPALSYLGCQISFAALDQAVGRTAAGLAQAGVRKGQAVAVLLPNTPWHPVCFLALMHLGARAVMLSPLDPPRALAHKLDDSGARLLLTTDLPGPRGTAEALLQAGGVDRVLVGADARWGGDACEPADWAEPIPEAPPQPLPAVGPDDVAVVQYTGGTTGTPKGAELTHGNLSVAVAIYDAWRDPGDLPPGQERVIGVLPLFHIYALTNVLLRHLDRGSEILLYRRFSVEEVLDGIERLRATTFPGVPTMWTALLNHPGAASRDFSSLRSCASGGAPLPQEVAARVERLIGQRLRVGWGMTETAPAGARVPLNEELTPGLIGVPLPGIRMRIVGLDDPGRELPPGEVGEIAIRGPNVFRGYLNRPEETRAAFRDGWFLTGDMGRMDRRGLFTLVDRRKRMIISGGFNVYPAMVENAVHEHPDVAECCVIAVPDPYRGEAAKAFVVLRAGAPELTLDALRDFLRDRLGRHEIPAALEVRAELPRSPAGKLLPSALEAEEAVRRMQAAGEAGMLDAAAPAA